MKIFRKSTLTGIEHTREIEISQAQIDAWRLGAPIQSVAPELSADDREFLISGITPEEWTNLFGEPE